MKTKESDPAGSDANICAWCSVTGKRKWDTQRARGAGAIDILKVPRVRTVKPAVSFKIDERASEKRFDFDFLHHDNYVPRVSIPTGHRKP